MRYPLRKIFLCSWAIFAVILNVLYAYSGSADGVGFANLLEALFAIIPAASITAIYLFWVYNPNGTEKDI